MLIGRVFLAEEKMGAVVRDIVMMVVGILGDVLAEEMVLAAVEEEEEMVVVVVVVCKFMDRTQKMLAQSTRPSCLALGRL